MSSPKKRQKPKESMSGHSAGGKKMDGLKPSEPDQDSTATTSMVPKFSTVPVAGLRHIGTGMAMHGIFLKALRDTA
jgi:hypothetical protein